MRLSENLTKQVLNTDEVRENKNYIATRKLKRSNSGFERKAEADWALKVGRLEHRLPMRIRGLADRHGSAAEKAANEG